MKEDQERTPLRTILQNFINHIESLETERIDDSYEKEFQELKFFSEILKTSKQYNCSEGEKEVNRKKNRYKDILPFDSSRVILEEYVGVPGSDYINANFIKGASGSPAYIASQGPLPHTVNDFWRMLVECEVQVIVMACNQEEAGKHKCENYWVEHEGEEKQFGMVTIRLLKASIVCPDFLVRTMLLKYTNGRATTERTVCQFHYSAWPDHGVPPLVRPLLDMVRLVRDTQASETLPVLVHCSAGCGRTGTICAIDYVFGLLRAGKLTKDFSLYTLVRDMRKQRIAMVQTKEQYVLVHQAVRELFCEQLRMIDAHPYENIDANGMPLIKEPMYDTINSSTNQEENAEKQDGKEKETGIGVLVHNNEPDSTRAPPLPHKKKLHVAASKQEKEVENLTEKRRCTVEQSSGSDSGSVSSGMGSLLSRPRIAKLKALFERNSSARESRNNRGRRHGSQQVTRSHSLGPVRKAEVDSSSPTVWRPIPGGGILRVPQLSTTAPAPKPALPVKRSKSLRVMGSGERQQLSVLVTDTGQKVPSSAQAIDSCDVVLVKSKCVASINMPSVSDKKPSVPPKTLLTSRDVETSDYSGMQARTSRDGMLQRQACGIDQRGTYSRHPGPSGWRSYENVPAPLRRRHSLESVILEDVPPSVDLGVARRADYVNVRNPSSSNESKFHNPSYMDKGARKLLQDCRDYLVNSFHPSSQMASKSINGKQSGKPNEDTFKNDQFKHLSLEAQRKVKAIVAGLGVRERRNSFRQAVDTCRDPARVRGRLQDYEAIWPGANKAGGTESRDLNKIWVQERKDIARALPAAYVPLSTQHSKSPHYPATDSHKLEGTSNPKTPPGKVEQGPYRNHGEERTQLYDRFKFSNHNAKSLAQKGGGSLRVKGTQVLAFSREHEIDDSGGPQQYKNLVIKKADSFEATNEQRYHSPPQPGSAYIGRTYTDIRTHSRSNPVAARGSTDQQRPSAGPDQGVYVKRTSSDDRLLFQEPKSNGISPLSKDTYNWSSPLNTSPRENIRRIEATNKPNSSLTFQEPTRASPGSTESSKPRTAGTLDKLSPRAILPSNSNPLLNSSPLSTVGSSVKQDRNSQKLPDPRTTRQGLATNVQETDEHQRLRNAHAMLRQTPRGPVQLSRKAYGKLDRDSTDGTSLTSPVAQSSLPGRMDEARKKNPTVSSSRADRDVYGKSAGFQQMRPGSQDDLALCPNAPPRVRRHASVVLLRRSLQETSDGASAAPLTVWNSSKEDADSWAAGTGVDVDAVAASIKRQPAGDQTATLARALESLHLRRASQRNESEQQLQPVPDPQGFTPPSLPVKKQHYL